MKLAWQGLIPLMLVMLLLSSLVVFLDLPMPKLWLLGCNVVLLLIGIFVGPRMPQGPPVNRRVPLAGSRFSPLSIAPDQA
jgi:NADH-quinone oxidoreductase subunit H